MPFDSKTSQARTADEREGELLRFLKAEENDALGYRQSELQQQQIDALKHYYGEAYGDEEEGRSRIVTREVFETIEWTRPDLMRVFAANGNVVYLEETSEEDSKYAKEAADYLSWIFFSDNSGYENLDDFAFDGLLHRRGFMACYWEEDEYTAPQELSGLDIDQIQQLMQDPSIEIIEHNFDEAESDQDLKLKIRKRKSEARAEIVTIAPEDMRVNGRTVDLDKNRYAGRVLRMLRGEIAHKWPEKAAAINEYSGSAVSGPQNIRRGSDVRMERFLDQSDDWQSTGNNAAQEIEVLEEYLRVDLNEDDYPELIRSYRMGDLILEESEVEENPFGSWTPIRIPHRFYGLSQHDITHDLQRQSTVLKRAGLDAVYQSVVNREAYDTNKVDLNSLLATYSGAKIAVDGPPGDSILPLTGGLATANIAWEALNQVAVTLENRTGATRQTQGVDPDVLLQGAHSGKAIDLLQTAAAARKEMMARNMGSGLGHFFSKVYRLVCRHQNKPRQLKIGGKECVFDPRSWNSDLRVSIHTGLGTGNRDQTVVGLQAIGTMQASWIDKVGLDNPSIGPKELYHTFEQMVQALGYRTADGFAKEPPMVPVTDEQGQPQIDPQTGQPQEKPWTPPPQQDPAMAKVQADAQASQLEMQLKQQTAVASHTLEQQKAEAGLSLQKQKDEAALQAQQEKSALDLQLAREKAQAEIDLANRKAEAEMQLAWATFEAEMQLAREKQAADIQMRRESLAVQREMHSEKTEAAVGMNSEKVAAQTEIHKNRPGGKAYE